MAVSCRRTNVQLAAAATIGKQQEGRISRVGASRKRKGFLQKGGADAKEHKYFDILCVILKIQLFCGYYFNLYNLQAI